MRRLEILKQNLRIINLINKIITLILIGLVCANFIFKYIIQSPFNPFSFVNSQYLLVILFNMFVYYFMNIRRVNLTEGNVKKLEIFQNTYLTLIISMGAFISLQGLNNYNPLLIYTIIQLICSSFLVLTFFQLFIPIALSMTVLLVGLPLLNGVNETYYMQVVYLFSITTISFLLASFHNKYFDQLIQYQLELRREANHNRELTKKLREVNRKLELQLLHDPLTNLFNRRAYNEYVKDLQNRIKEKPLMISVIMLDVDCFKQYNDTYGHFEGDNVLIKIGEILQNISRKFNCFVARWGGEEFSFILVDEPSEIIEEICKQIISETNQLKIEHHTSNVDHYVTVSVGAYSKIIETPKEIVDCINLADQLLYNVKQNGRNNFSYKKEIDTIQNVNMEN